MKSDIELLFYYLDTKNFEAFKKNLTPDLVNTVYVDTLYDYDYTGYAGGRVKRKQTQKQLLIFRAMLRESCEAFELLLEYGADLLLQESFGTVDYARNGLNAKPEIAKTDIAIICISNSENPQFIQMTFDHICARGLYEKPIYIDFMIRHLDEVNLEKFNPKFLRIDVGSPLPFCFETVEEYKAFLMESNIDLTGIFFVKEDYLNFILDPTKKIDGAFLSHALAVCEFTLDELKQIHGFLESEELKRMMEDFNPELNPEFLLALGEVSLAQEEKQSPLKKVRSESLVVHSPPSSLPQLTPSKLVTEITAVHEQEFRHLTSRIAVLEGQEIKLREKLGAKKQLQKDKDALNLVLRSLKDCRGRLHNNHFYKNQKSIQESEQFEENSPSL